MTPHGFDSYGLERLKRFGITTVQDEVNALVRQEGRLVAVMTASGTEVACDAVFVAASMRAASALAASLCEVDKDGFAITNADGQTSRPGIWAIGNANDPLGHLAHAAAAGARVGP